MVVSSARLFYDDACGPCTLGARAVAAFSRHRVGLAPLDSREADLLLGDLSTETRFGSMHLVRAGGRLTGAEGVLPLVGLVLGPRVEKALDVTPGARAGLARIYRFLWRERQRHGCGVRPAA